MTLEELAIEFGLAREHVKQLDARVIEKLGDSLRGLKVANQSRRGVA